MKRKRLILSALAIALLAFGASAAFAQDGDIPQVTIEKTSEGFTVPAELPEGVVSVTFDNQTDAPISPILARLNADATPEQLQAAAAEDPFAALQLVSLLGGTMIAPQTTYQIVYDLQPGQHVVIDFSSEAPAMPTFAVTDANGDSAAEPEADVQVNLLDFAFSFPLQLSAGPQTWAIANHGAQWHELAFMQVPDDMTVAEFRAMVGEIATGEAAPEGEPFFFAPLNQGERAWIELDLQPGTYIIACFLPDFASGHAHADLGMVQVFNVSE